MMSKAEDIPEDHPVNQYSENSWIPAEELRDLHRNPAIKSKSFIRGKYIINSAIAKCHIAYAKCLIAYAKCCRSHVYGASWDVGCVRL